jgi:hypothetical protein
VGLQPVGVAWYLGALVVLGAAALPRRWFSDEPAGVTGSTGAGGPGAD